MNKAQHKLENREYFVPDPLLMLEFLNEAAQLVPRGWIYSIRYGHKLSFYGLENLVEKVNRIYYLLEFSETTTDYPGSFLADGRFFFLKKCLEDRAAWKTRENEGTYPQPEHWGNCLIINPLSCRGNCWQGTVVWKRYRLNYGNIHDLKELLSRCWLDIKGLGSLIVPSGECHLQPDVKERLTGS